MQWTRRLSFAAAPFCAARILLKSLMNRRWQISSFSKSLTSLLAITAHLIACGLSPANDCPADFKHGCIKRSSETDLPDPHAGKERGYFGRWETQWGLEGTEGIIKGTASASSVQFPFTGYPTVSTETHTASGFVQERVGGWHGGALRCKEPHKARVTGQVDGTVTCSVHMDANNNDLDSGSNAALARAKIIVTGIVTGSIDINLDASYREEGIKIGGTLTASKSSGAKIHIQTSIGSDIADAQAADSISLSDHSTGPIGGQLQKAHAACSVMARINNGATESTAKAIAKITQCTVTPDSGGLTRCNEAICTADPPEKCN